MQVSGRRDHLPGHRLPLATHCRAAATNSSCDRGGVLRGRPCHQGAEGAGLKDGPVWDRACKHMERGWMELTARLQQRFEHGPIDWSSQAMMWKERAQRDPPSD
jgi:hypothetical protein